MSTTTNIEEFEKHLKSVFGGMMQSKELLASAKEAKVIMGQSVIEKLNTSGYDYDQTGQFREVMVGELKDTAIDIGKTRLTIGFGDLDQLNDPLSDMRSAQTMNFIFNNHPLTVNTKAETQMPKWIVLEFGRSGSRESSDFTNGFSINYTPRPDKKFLSPQSRALMNLSKKERVKEDAFNKKHNGDEVYQPSNLLGGFYYNKPTYFMMSEATFQRFTQDTRDAEPIEHPGIKPGKFFQRGLESSKFQVFNVLFDGIQNYLDKN